MFPFFGRVLVLATIACLAFLFLPIVLALAFLPAIEARARRWRPVAAPIALLAFLVLVFAPMAAFAAEDAMVPLAPWVALIQPYVQILFETVLAIVIPVLAAKIHAKWNVDIDQAHQRTFQTALTNAAGLLIAKGGSKLVGQVVNVKSPELADAITYVQKAAPDALARFDLGPEAVAEKILAKVPQIGAVPAAG